MIGATAVVCLGSLIVALRLIYDRSVLVSLVSWFAAMLVIATVIAFVLGRLGLTPWTLGVGSAIGVVAMLAVVAAIVRTVLHPMRELVRAVDRLVDGDVAIAIACTSQDEIGTVAARLRELIAYLQSMGEMAAAVTQGVLTQRIEPRSAKDVLGAAFRDMIANLRALIGEVQTSANDLADTSQQLGDGANQASQAVQQVTMAVQNVAVGAEDTSRSWPLSRNGAGLCGMQHWRDAEGRRRRRASKGIVPASAFLITVNLR